MSDLLKQPIWQGQDLGKAIPSSPHAISVALPRWQDVVGYEEKRPEVISRLATGYPRFVIHPKVRSLASTLSSEKNCLPFPSLHSAEQCAAFVRRISGQPTQIVGLGEVHGVVTSATGAAALQAFWQHTGLIVSSRQAEAVMEGRAQPPDTNAIRASLRRQLADFYDCRPDDVFLTATGMAAQFAALRSVNLWRPNRPTVQLGFPYVDTLKLQQKLGYGGILLHDLERIEADLHHLMEQQTLAGCFCEIPGNPLLGSADVRKVSPLLRQHGVPLIADDVVATPFNVNLLPYADLIATSLTKYIAGTGDVMGGALICNPRSPYYQTLKSFAQMQHEELLWGEEAAVLDAQARTFPERMQQHNRNGLYLAERLRQHPCVERVWYPKWEFSGAYEAVRRPEGGYGSLITFLPKQAELNAPKIYDAMAVCKGPSLGTVFSLACPFTLLAHYSELEWAEACGVSRYLIRISVGLEEPEELWQRVKTALETTNA
ncbi:MAG: PLP-dependent transferase [Verrucomicrobiota bacterium]